MVKHTQIIRRQKPTNCVIVFDHFLRLALKGLSNTIQNILNNVAEDNTDGIITNLT